MKLPACENCGRSLEAAGLSLCAKCSRAPFPARLTQQQRDAEEMAYIREQHGLSLNKGGTHQ